jgi:uncharacterized iron-regulated membrane protein
MRLHPVVKVGALAAAAVGAVAYGAVAWWSHRDSGHPAPPRIAVPPAEEVS